MSDELTPLELAVYFHVAYERLSAQFNYVTRTETRIFDPESPNGKLMVAVCAEIIQDHVKPLESQLAAAQQELEALRKEYDEEVISHDIEETDLKARVAAHVQTIREREAEIAQLREREEQLAAKTKECEEAAKLAEVRGRAHNGALNSWVDAKAEIAKLREALRDYGQHSIACEAMVPVEPLPCDCGLDAALAQPAATKEEKLMINLPYQKQLTVVISDNLDPVQADSDIQSVKDGGTIIQTGISEAYFHRLRRRVAEDPTLADKIAAFYLKDGVLIPVGLGYEDELKWPTGFLQAGWEEECRINEARKAMPAAEKEFKP